MSGALVPGTIQLMWTSEEKHLYKILQVIEVCSIGSNRLKLVVSDGEFYQQALLNLAPDHPTIAKLAEFCLICVIDYTVQAIEQGVKVVIITDTNFISNPGYQIGTPRNLEAVVMRPLPVIPPPRPEEDQRLEDRRSEVSRRAEVDRSAAEGYAPIKALTTMMTDWVIKARVVSKDKVKEWSNPRGTGRLFSCVLMDVLGTEIQATFFQEGVNLHYDKITEGSVYTFSNGQVKLARSQFNLTGNPYQLNFDGKAIVTEVLDDRRIGSLKYNLVPLDQLSSLPKNSKVDICAVAIEVGEAVDFVSKKGEALIKRVLKLIDQTQTSVELTLWGEMAKSGPFNSEHAQQKLVLLGKGLRTSDFNTISLTADKTSKLTFSDNENEAVRSITRWRDTELHKVRETVDLSVKTSSPMKRDLRTLKEIKAIWEGPQPPRDEQSYYVHGYIGLVKHDDPNSMWYTACRNADRCKKKVAMESTGSYRCENCQESFAECERRFILSLRLHDSTGHLWAGAFDDAGVPLLGGKSANDLFRLNLSEEGRNEFEFICQDASCKQYDMTIRAKINEGPQGPKPRYTVAYATAQNTKRATDLYMKEIAEAFERHQLV
jgi:replication factor A1